ncbi:MAG TPA: rhodanese-like domain-containing protein [Methylomirabilota bacterium]|nr:rhodanese-like domain-containing protein [Methylomirabilota bacterium]
MIQLVFPSKNALGFVAILLYVLFLPSWAHADPSKYPQFAQQSPPDNVVFVSIDDLARDLKAGAKPLIIDVRTAAEFREGHIFGAVSAPLGDFNAYVQNIPKNRLVILY